MVELLEELRKMDEVALIELLGITSEQLVDAFIDEINDKSYSLRKAIEEDL